MLTSADITYLVIVAVIGLVAGSFINVVIVRLHAGKDFTKGRSHCPKCDHTLSPWELVPIASWVALRGRCRSCGKGISVQYPLIELLTAIIFLLAYWTHPLYSYGALITLLLWFYILGSLIVLAVYDLRWYLLPDKVLLPILVPGAAVLISATLITHSYRVILGAVLAGIVFGGAFYLLALVSRGKWMGGGDIKLAFVMGILLGVRKTALAMIIACVVAAVVSLVLILLKRKTRQDVIPFGPFLIGGTVVAYLWGGTLLMWYGAQLGLNLL